MRFESTKQHRVDMTRFKKRYLALGFSDVSFNDWVSGVTNTALSKLENDSASIENKEA